MNTFQHVPGCSAISFLCPKLMNAIEDLIGLHGEDSNLVAGVNLGKHWKSLMSADFDEEFFSSRKIKD